MPKWKEKFDERLEDIEEIPQEPFKVVSRSEWTDCPCPDSLPVLKLPCMEVVVTTTAGDPCESKEQCYQLLREMREDHIIKGYGDIAHNFLISTDGTVYEGRGWSKEAFRLNKKPETTDKQCMQVAFFGTWGTGMDHDRPEEAMCHSLQELLEHGFENRFLVEAVTPSDPPEARETFVDISMFD